MADRTSAEIFGMIFQHLAKNPTPDNLEFAKFLFEKSHNYDFSTYQMYCDKALRTLGLPTGDEDDD